MAAPTGEDPTHRPTEAYPRRPRDARRTGARILDTAEGVLAALRGCRIDRAFIELMQTAKQYDVNPVRLADALVAIAEDHLTNDIDGPTANAALASWGHLLGVADPGGAREAKISPDADGGQATASTAPASPG